MKADNGFFLVKGLFQIPPYPISDVSVSTIKLAFGFIRDRHRIDLTRDLMFWTVLVCSSVYGFLFF